ncbi:MAG: hypothetical protein KGM98_14075 [Bacteroidota bacterium]|nr:hypothetical protein [Bacteroidota bacterium]
MDRRAAIDFEFSANAFSNGTKLKVEISWLIFSRVFFGNYPSDLSTISLIPRTVSIQRGNQLSIIHVGSE